MSPGGEGTTSTASANEERMALLNGGEVPEFALDKNESSAVSADPTQQLLTALGHFQRAVQSAFDDSSQELWADECMNQLILGVEIALSQEWPELMEAFTDAGRILQSCENADRASEALTFLDGSYELLCQIVGEQMGGSVRPEVVERWQKHYQQGVRVLETNDVTIIVDDEDEMSETGAIASEEEAKPGRGEVVPFEFPDLDNKETPKWEAEEELPTLDELPPLESMVPPESETKDESESAATELPEMDELDELGGALEEEAPPEPPGIAPIDLPELGDSLAAEDSAEIAESPEADELPALGDSLEPQESADTADVVEAIDEPVAEETPAVLDDPFEELIADPEPEAASAELEEEGTSLEAPSEAVASEAPDGSESVSEPPASEKTSVEPSRVVVDIVDRICDELARLGDMSVEERKDSFETIQGGVTALKREAEQGNYETSTMLCDRVAKLCSMALDAHRGHDERFCDVAFGFCGIYVEAMSDGESENVRDWTTECVTLMKDLLVPVEDETDSAPATEETHAASEPEPLESPAPAEPAAESAPAPAPENEADIIEEAPPTPPAPEPLPEPAAPLAPAASAPEPSPEPTTPAASASGSAPGSTNVESQLLFVKAQEALSQGDTEAAKRFALQAAAAIADAEVLTAVTKLKECEDRLRGSLDATTDARNSVKESEKIVKKSASEVLSGEKSLGEAKEHSAEMAQELEEAETEVAELKRQLEEIQKQRDEQVAQAEGVQTKLHEAKGKESQMDAHLEGLRAAEEEARKSLESARQKVKDYQRATTDIEGEMEHARELLTRHKMSFDDIHQTLGGSGAQSENADGESGELLF